MTGLLLVAWCLDFAAVNAWQLATGRLTDDEFRGYTTALVVASILVLLLKLVGAAVALASRRTVHHHRVHAYCRRSTSGRMSESCAPYDTGVRKRLEHRCLPVAERSDRDVLHATVPQ